MSAPDFPTTFDRLRVLTNRIGVCPSCRRYMMLMDFCRDDDPICPMRLNTEPPKHRNPAP